MVAEPYQVGEGQVSDLVRWWVTGAIGAETAARQQALADKSGDLLRAENAGDKFINPAWLAEARMWP